MEIEYYYFFNYFWVEKHLSVIENAYFCTPDMSQHNENELSILIPVYNHVCVELVGQLHQQAVALGIDFEIIVADDGSTSKVSIEANRTISSLNDCCFIERKENIGRAAIRNFLARKAHYAYILYIDCDMTMVNSNFLQSYLACLPAMVVDGGVTIFAQSPEQERLLRYRYEKAEEPHHTATERQKTPYQYLHTANLLIRRDIMLKYPFDERLRHYGYEDVLLGKTLHRYHITITHIDNPLGFCTFEPNTDFMAKTEEGLRTLCEFRSDLRGYSRLLTFVSGIHIPAILWLIRLWHQLFGQIERRNLCGSHPYLLIFKIYRLGYFLNI